jgi:hypothetical protein
MLEFGDKYIRLYTNRGVVLQGAPAGYSGATAYGIGDLVSSGGVNRSSKSQPTAFRDPRRLSLLTPVTSPTLCDA